MSRGAVLGGDSVMKASTGLEARLGELAVAGWWEIGDGTLREVDGESAGGMSVEGGGDGWAESLRAWY